MKLFRFALPAALLALLPAGSAFAASAWTPFGPPGGSVRSLAIAPGSPGELYAGTYGGGVFKSTDGGGPGLRSRPPSATRRFPPLAVDPSQPQTVLPAPTATALWKSVDGGATWKRILHGGPGVRRAAGADQRHCRRSGQPEDRLRRDRHRPERRRPSQRRRRRHLDAEHGGSSSQLPDQRPGDRSEDSGDALRRLEQRRRLQERRRRQDLVALGRDAPQGDPAVACRRPVHPAGRLCRHDQQRPLQVHRRRRKLDAALDLEADEGRARLLARDRPRQSGGRSGPGSRTPFCAAPTAARPGPTRCPTRTT